MKNDRDGLTICEAEDAYDTVPEHQSPEEPGLLYVQGQLAARNGQYAIASAYLARAAAADLSTPKYFAQLGDALNKDARPTEAVSAYLSALVLGLRDSALYCRLARALADAGMLTAASVVCQESLRLNPDDARAHAVMGDLLFIQCRHHEAVAHYLMALELSPDNAPGYARLGRVYLALRQWDQALHYFRQALERRPDDPTLHADVGETLLHAGSLLEATRAFRIASGLSPRDLRACGFLVSTLELRGLTHDAVGAWFSLGMAFESADRFQDAAEAYQQALTRKPDCLRALTSLARVQVRLGNPEIVARFCKRALEIDPDHRVAHVRLGWALECLGQLPAAWEEFRWYYSMGRNREFEQPLWDGSALNGRHILLWVDLGLGDAIRDLRYVPLVKARGGRVTIECPQSLVSLVEHCEYADETVAQRTALPAFDVHAPLLALPRIFSIRRDTIPSRVPYITVDDALVRAWSQRLGTSRYAMVGITWSSDLSRDEARLKSVPLAALAPLGSVPNIRFVSLQIGQAATELRTLSPRWLDIATLLDESCAIADTAALMLNLDLIVSVDTMTAHLAGALARPVWTLAPYACASWLWPRDDEISAWYPTMRVFRQTCPGDWQSVIQRVTTALRVEMANEVFKRTSD